MEIIDSYIGIKPFKVLIDESSELEEIAQKARELRGLTFENKFEKITKLCLFALENAYEISETNDDLSEKEENTTKKFAEKQQLARELLRISKPLSYALQNGFGSDKHQAALFFILGYESKLGISHFIQQAPYDPFDLWEAPERGIYNDIVNVKNKKKIITHVSLFQESLSDYRLDLTKQNPHFFESAVGFGWPKQNPCPENDPWCEELFSYHEIDKNYKIVSRHRKHVKNISEIKEYLTRK